MILHFIRTLCLTKPGDEGYVEEYTCIEHPRLSHMQQFFRNGGIVHTRFCVLGIDHYFPSIAHALFALAANPLPGDICAVVPWEFSNEG